MSDLKSDLHKAVKYTCLKIHGKNVSVRGTQDPEGSLTSPDKKLLVTPIFGEVGVAGTEIRRIDMAEIIRRGKKKYVRIVDDWKYAKDVKVTGEREEEVFPVECDIDECIDKYTKISIHTEGTGYSRDEIFYLRRAVDFDGRSEIELKANVNGIITPRVILNPSNMIKGLKNLESYGIYICEETTSDIITKVKSCWKTLQVRVKNIKLGFNLDLKGKIDSFRAGVAVGKDGQIYKNEPEDALPIAKGTVDKDILAEVLKNVKRRLAVLHGLIAPLVGMASLENENQVNPILLITGDSSTGKTTIARYVQSLSTDPTYDRTCLDFDSTEKYLLKMLGENAGVSVMIDDTSLGMKNNWKQLIYSLANQAGRSAIGKEYGRSGTSITLTSERNIIYGVPADYKGIHVRIFGMEIKNGEDLFESPDLVKRVEQSTNNNHGIILPVIVNWMFKKTLPKIKELIEKEEKNIADLYNEDNNVITRWYRYFAYMKVVALALDETLGVKVDVDEVINYMITEIKLTLEKRSIEETNSKLKDLYWELYKKSFTKGDGRYIYCNDYKKVVKAQLNDLQLHYGEVANKLEQLELLEVENGTLYPNINKSRAYKLKKVEVLEKALEEINKK